MDRLRVGIDGYNLAMPNGTGVATYGLTLARTLAAAGHRVEGVFGIDIGRSPVMGEILFYDRIGRDQPRMKARWRKVWLPALRPRITATAREVAASGRVATAAFADRLPAFDRLVSSANLFEIAHRHFTIHRRFICLRMRNPPQVMHWTYPVPVVLEGARNIYTLHDIVPIKLPYTTLNDKTDYRALVKGCIDRADRICTVSEASRADIVAEFGVAPDRIVNTYQASSLPAALPPPDPETEAAAMMGVFGLRRHGYFLYFGATEPKKNVGRLLEAFLSLDGDTPLVMVSGRSWQSEGELSLLAGNSARRLAERVVRLDHLPRPLLLQLVRNARAVVFPSIYEGFGLPVLEAMQLGTPVLTSDVSSLPEVAGDAALLVDPYDVAAIAAGLRRLDADEALRRRLARAGPERAAMFSADRYLARLERLYRETIGAMA